MGTDNGKMTRLARKKKIQIILRKRRKHGRLKLPGMNRNENSMKKTKSTITKSPLIDSVMKLRMKPKMLQMNSYLTIKALGKELLIT